MAKKHRIVIPDDFPVGPKDPGLPGRTVAELRRIEELVMRGLSAHPEKVRLRRAAAADPNPKN